VADALRKEPGLEVELVDGNRGEFTVLVDGQMVTKKRLIFKPAVEKVLQAVRKANPARARH
jgi:hypothetical protein